MLTHVDVCRFDDVFVDAAELYLKVQKQCSKVVAMMGGQVILVGVQACSMRQQYLVGAQACSIRLRIVSLVHEHYGLSRQCMCRLRCNSTSVCIATSVCDVNQPPYDVTQPRYVSATM